MAVTRLDLCRLGLSFLHKSCAPISLLASSADETLVNSLCRMLSLSAVEGDVISFTAIRCTILSFPCCSGGRLDEPIMLHPSSVRCAKGSFMLPVTTSRGASADGQSQPINSPTSQSWSAGNLSARCLR